MITKDLFIQPCSFLQYHSLENYENVDFGVQLNITNHYAVLPHKYVITQEFIKDVPITTKEEALTMVKQYYPDVSELLLQVIPELREAEDTVEHS